MKIIDIIALLFILLGGFIGYKRGAVKGLVQFICLLAISIVANQFKGYLTTILVKNLPYFNFAGRLVNLQSVNVFLYDAFSFLIIFIVLYCVLNILLTISGLLEILDKASFILELPSKVVGVILGILESIIFVFVAGVFFLEVPQTQTWIVGSSVVQPIVERTPIVNVIFRYTIASSEKVELRIEQAQNEEDKQNANVDILSYCVGYKIVDASIIQEAIDNNKLPLPNVTITGATS